MFHVEHGKYLVIKMNKIYMKYLINLAKKAYSEDEVPVGAIVVKNNNIIGVGYNKKEQLNNPVMHAEVIAIVDACEKNKDWRLDDCELYVTLSPCVMCQGLIRDVRIKKVYYLLKSSEQMFDIINAIKYDDFDMEQEILDLMQKFFKNKRNG